MERRDRLSPCPRPLFHYFPFMSAVWRSEMRRRLLDCQKKKNSRKHDHFSPMNGDKSILQSSCTPFSSDERTGSVYLWSSVYLDTNTPCLVRPGYSLVCLVRLRQSIQCLGFTFTSLPSGRKSNSCELEMNRKTNSRWSKVKTKSRHLCGGRNSLFVGLQAKSQSSAAFAKDHAKTICISFFFFCWKPSPHAVCN